MRVTDVTRTALGNTMRSKLRTFLTVIAIVIGAFTLAVTTGLGAGVSKYVDSVVEGYGDADQMTVMAGDDADEMDEATTEPQEYDADDGGSSEEMWGTSMLSEDDIETIEEIDGVTNVDPIFFVGADYMEIGGTEYDLSELGVPAEAQGMSLASGEMPDSDAMELTVPQSWLTLWDDSTDDWEEADAEAPLGETVEIGITNQASEQDSVEAEIVGVSEEALTGAGGSPMPSHALNDELYEIQNSGVDVEQSDSYVQAMVDIENIAENEDAIKEALQDEGMMGLTIEDMLGMVQGVIDAVTWVLAGFAMIALLAASFGIVNTLLMSVQERTREIGLMKALGMSRGRVFGLFSMEAMLIGFMGSVVGVGLGVAVGVVGNNILVNGPLANVADLTLYSADPVGLAGIAGLILVISFVAGTLPAYRAAKKDPIEALRYE